MSLRDPSSVNHGQSLEMIGRQVSPGAALLVTLAATKNTTAPAGTTVSAQLLAASSARVGAVIVNADPAKTLYLAFNGAAAVVGVGTAVGPNASVFLTEAQVAGQTNGVWQAGVTGGASVTEYVA